MAVQQANLERILYADLFAKRKELFPGVSEQKLKGMAPILKEIVDDIATRRMPYEKMLASARSVVLQYLGKDEKGLKYDPISTGVTDYKKTQYRHWCECDCDNCGCPGE